MRLKILVLLGVFLFSFVSVAHASSTESDFILGGCTFSFEGETIGVLRGQCSTNPFGEFYCDLDGNGLITTEVGLGCAMGDENYNRDENDDFCCPDGYFCDGDAGTGEFSCEERGLVDCLAINNDNGGGDACRDAGCIWLNEAGYEVGSELCVASVKDRSCAYYRTRNTCNADRYQIGKKGIGAGLINNFFECNSQYYTVPVTTYRCNWTESGDCRFTYSAVQTGIGIGEDPNMFSCLKSYDADECDEDGKQEVSWTSENSIEQGFDDSVIPEECLTAFGCGTGSIIIECGQDIIKLPGFSMFALFGSLCFIAIYYIFKKD